MDRAMLTRHLFQAERHLAESEAHVRLYLEHVHRAVEKNQNSDQQRHALELAISLRLLHGNHVARLRSALGVPDHAVQGVGRSRS
jgi:hypothetical protein